MKIFQSSRGREGASTLLAYLFVALAVMATITGIATYVVQNMKYSQRRQDMVNAYQFAQGGAAIACLDVQQAFTNSGSFLNNLTTNLYVKNNALSSPTELVYERTISSPFTNQTVAAQLRMTNSSAPNSAKIFATATVGKVTQTAQVNVEMGFSSGNAAILSTHQGTSSSGVSKSTAQAGNVVVDGGSKGTTKIDGGILANGNANINQAQVGFISDQLYGTADEIPDYTDPGSQYQLFDFNRFMKIADLTGQHYTNLTEFIAKAKTATLEGVVAVNIKFGEGQSLDSKDFPSGINIRGTLIFNFIPNSKGQNWDPLDKIVNTATMNINAANLSGLIPSNPATYPSGYPPTYTDTTKKPSHWDITPYNFDNFTDADDLPALMYNNAILDIHGNVNICGVVYSSSFMEIENKQSSQTQYFRGALIGGGGIFVDNGSGAISIVSYDAAAVGNLATAGSRGKTVKAVYRK